ncbi:sulfotransferase family 2 domain-containing protein [Okeania sp. KiyG1]|uniref:sulfotransferase family 2 domain-containing protein n=1 Tax=Okeania sp. KiyG1 TaxID=2720165 RepID=UPI0019221DE8|nr:sulfotransferase family 2 domain-containing protein [Okeania sp. KiyG1]GGA13492.1 hypothetical protein CYANOKiyG1_26840 [Okeania sp. KiyG1]
MLISHKHKFIFVHVQKTAGQSVTETLKKNVPDLEKLVTQHKHGSAITGRDILGVDKWNEYYKFAFVRNPWDRLVSWYSMILGICLDEKMSQNYSNYNLWHKVVRNYRKYRYLNRPHNSKFYSYVLKNCNSFEDFIKNSHRDNMKNMRNQLDYLVDEEGNIIVDFIGKFESLGDDFNQLKSNLNLPHMELPHVTHKSKHRNYQEYYNDEIREIVQERYHQDIKYFNYNF